MKNKMIRPVSLTLTILCLHIGLVTAQPVDTTVLTALKHELKTKKVPGGVVGVLDGERVTCLAAAGIANTETGQPVSTDMLFRLGSTTKMVVATAVLLMAHEGLLDLGAPIGTYLPNLPSSLKIVTMEQVLTHTAGIQNEAPMFGPDDDGALAREIESWTGDRRFLEPGEAFSYSNPGYWLAGRILEVRDHKPFAAIIRDRVFTPLGMKLSTFRPEVAQQHPLAAPHDRDEEIIDPAPNHAGTWPSGSMYSTVPELLRFTQAVMNDGMLDGKRILPSVVVQTLLRPRVEVKAPAGIRYGYGLMHKMWRGFPTVYHTGARAGYGSIIDMIPSRRLAVVVLGNRTGSLLTSTVKAGYATRTTLGVLEEEDLPQGEYITDPKRMEEYIGMYVNSPSIKIEIYNRSALPLVRVGEILTIRRGQERIPLQIVNDSTATNGFQLITFTRDASGEIRLLHYEMHTLKRQAPAIDD